MGLHQIKELLSTDKERVCGYNRDRLNDLLKATHLVMDIGNISQSHVEVVSLASAYTDPSFGDWALGKVNGCCHWSPLLYSEGDPGGEVDRVRNMK